MGPDESTASSRARRSKVARLIEEYDLQGLGAELEQLWMAEETRKSLWESASYFNQQLLKRALEESNVQYLDGEIKKHVSAVDQRRSQQCRSDPGLAPPRTRRRRCRRTRN